MPKPASHYVHPPSPPPFLLSQPASNQTLTLAHLARHKLTAACAAPRAGHLRILVLHANFLERVMGVVEAEARARDFARGVRTTGRAEGSGWDWDLERGSGGGGRDWGDEGEGGDEEYGEDVEGWAERWGAQVQEEEVVDVDLAVRRVERDGEDEDGDDLFRDFVDGLWEEQFPPAYDGVGTERQDEEEEEEGDALPPLTVAPLAPRVGSEQQHRSVLPRPSAGKRRVVAQKAQAPKQQIQQQQHPQWQSFARLFTRAPAAERVVAPLLPSYTYPATTAGIQVGS